MVVFAEVEFMVSKGKSRFYKRKDDKYLIYLPVSLGKDSMFPFSMKPDSDVPVKIYFDEDKKLVIEEWNDEN